MIFLDRLKSAGFLIPQLDRETLQRTYPDSSCRLLDGSFVSSLLVEQCRSLAGSRKVKPHLVVILAGEDPASQVYVKNKALTFEKAGFTSDTIRISSAECSTRKLLDLVDTLNADEKVHGILVQLPLPAGSDAMQVIHRIAPEKDVDGFHPVNAGLLATGDARAILPATPYGVLMLLAAYGIDLKGKEAVVVGRSNNVGKPAATLLLGGDATVTTAHSRTRNLSEVTKRADILVACAGKLGLITKDMVKPGAVVVDVGIHRGDDGKLYGDVDREVISVASAMSPVPKGVGPMTIAMLLVNTCLAAWRDNERV